MLNVTLVSEIFSDLRSLSNHPSKIWPDFRPKKKLVIHFQNTFGAISRPLAVRLAPFQVHICALQALQIHLMH